MASALLKLCANVNSPSLTTRAVKYSEHDDHSVLTHQPQYAGVGLFPSVQLNKSALKLPSWSPGAVSRLTRSPVMVKIGKPLSPEASSYSLLDRSQILSENRGYSDQSTKNVLEVLREISRKRIHSDGYRGMSVGTHIGRGFAPKSVELVLEGFFNDIKDLSLPCHKVTFLRHNPCASQVLDPTPLYSAHTRADNPRTTLAAERTAVTDTQQGRTGDIILDDVDEETAKRQRKEDGSDLFDTLSNCEITDSLYKSKRTREESPKQDSDHHQQQPKKRICNNEILSSLSSSRNMRVGAGVKRKTAAGTASRFVVMMLFVVVCGWVRLHRKSFIPIRVITMDGWEEVVWMGRGGLVSDHGGRMERGGLVSDHDGWMERGGPVSDYDERMGRADWSRSSTPVFGKQFKKGSQSADDSLSSPPLDAPTTTQALEKIDVIFNNKSPRTYVEPKEISTFDKKPKKFTLSKITQKHPAKYSTVENILIPEKKPQGKCIPDKSDHGKPMQNEDVFCLFNKPPAKLPSRKSDVKKDSEESKEKESPQTYFVDDENEVDSVKSKQGYEANRKDDIINVLTIKSRGTTKSQEETVALNFQTSPKTLTSSTSIVTTSILSATNTALSVNNSTAPALVSLSGGTNNEFNQQPKLSVAPTSTLASVTPISFGVQLAKSPSSLPSIITGSGDSISNVSTSLTFPSASTVQNKSSLANNLPPFVSTASSTITSANISSHPASLFGQTAVSNVESQKLSEGSKPNLSFGSQQLPTATTSAVNIVGSPFGALAQTSPESSVSRNVSSSSTTTSQSFASLAKPLIVQTIQNSTDSTAHVQSTVSTSAPSSFGTPQVTHSSTKSFSSGGFSIPSNNAVSAAPRKSSTDPQQQGFAFLPSAVTTTQVSSLPQFGSVATQSNVSFQEGKQNSSRVKVGGFSFNPQPSTTSGQATVGNQTISNPSLQQSAAVTSPPFVLKPPTSTLGQPIGGFSFGGASTTPNSTSSGLGSFSSSTTSAAPIPHSSGLEGFPSTQITTTQSTSLSFGGFSTSTAPSNFGFGSSNEQKPFSFGASSAPTATISSTTAPVASVLSLPQTMFGSPQQQSNTGQQSSFQFGGSPAKEQIQGQTSSAPLKSGTFSFGSTNSSTLRPGGLSFGGAKSSQESAQSSGFAFGGNSSSSSQISSSSGFGFGSNATQPQPKSSNNGFNFNSTTSRMPQSTTSGGFELGNVNVPVQPSKPSGAFNFGSPSVASQPTTTSNGGFSSGSGASIPQPTTTIGGFGFGTSQMSNLGTGSFSFSGTNSMQGSQQQPSSSTAFSLGSSTSSTQSPRTEGFGFGGGSTQQPLSGFAAAPTQSSQQSLSVFGATPAQSLSGFGAAPTSQQQLSGFGITPAQSSQQSSGFGATSTSQQQVSGFGATPAQSSQQPLSVFGATPAQSSQQSSGFGSTSSQPLSSGGVFNFGNNASGGSQPAQQQSSAGALFGFGSLAAAPTAQTQAAPFNFNTCASAGAPSQAGE
uniref:Uncharacterized protein n=1 Tax=Timema poppense TaxID=170557 RepID=A0A7R9DCZ3_TIMPO|nr:unnamed protein product [Timema poppensis]